METKRVTEDFVDRTTMISWTPNDIKSTMEGIERFFEECDEELAKAEMLSLGYEKQPIDTIIEHMVILKEYVRYAHQQCYTELDHPLFEGFKNGATETLSNIILEEITTDNTFEMQRYVEVYDSTGHYYTSELKMVLTMKDFLGLDAVIPEEGVFVIANVESIGWFTDLFRADYENMGTSVESLDQMLEAYLYSGEYSHKEYHPIGNFISGILDVTIIKPFIESIAGQDLITGEKLTDFERGMQLVNAVVGAVTFGQGALALDFSEMTAKEIAVELVKIWGVDAISDASAYTAGYACDELGMPAGVSFLASMLTGCTVSVESGKYIFRDGDNIVKKLDADGMQKWLKSMDMDDMTGGSGYKSVIDDIITDGSHLENGKLKANVTYKTGEYDYIYKTNGDGLIVKASTDNLQLKSHEGRLKHNPNTYGKEAGDHAGHLFGDRFGGSPELDNLVSQAKNVNLSEYKVIENRWANALENGQKVTVDIKINYDVGGIRPTSFDVSYTIDGARYYQKIFN